MVLGDFALLVLVAGGMAFLVSYLSRRSQAPELSSAGWTSEWVAHHGTAGDYTVVSVRRRETLGQASRTAEEREVGRVSNTDADLDSVFLELMEKARNRAFLLNSEPND